jgi:hypothetical protein
MKIKNVTNLLVANGNSALATLSQTPSLAYTTRIRYYPGRRHFDRQGIIEALLSNVVFHLEVEDIPKTVLDLGCGAVNTENGEYHFDFEPWVCRILQRLKTEPMEGLVEPYCSYAPHELEMLRSIYDKIRPQRVVGIDCCPTLEGETFENYVGDMLDPTMYTRFEPHSFGIISTFSSFNSPTLSKQLTGKAVFTNNPHPEGEREFERLLPALERILHPNGVILRSFL